MNTHNVFKIVLVLFGISLFAASAGLLRADTIETKNGSRLSGKITQIDSLTVILKTDFAGDIKIKLSEVVSVTTDKPVNLRLNDGEVLKGQIANATVGSPQGAIVVSAPEATVVTNLRKVTDVWGQSEKDPELVKLERHWRYEAGLDIMGKTGNAEQVGTALSFKATLQSAFDKLVLSTNYNRQITDGQKSTDKFQIGGDYQNNFSGRTSWYARDMAGFDHVNDIDWSNTAATGFGYDAIKNKIDTLTLRAGISYRYEDYISSAPTLRELGLDLGLVNQLTMKTWSMTNRISYTPAFEDFGTYKIEHESYIELPLANPHWKFRIGMTNDYNSTPSPGLERLDTTYYAKLLLNWK